MSRSIIFSINHHHQCNLVQWIHTFMTTGLESMRKTSLCWWMGWSTSLEMLFVWSIIERNQSIKSYRFLMAGSSLHFGILKEIWRNAVDESCFPWLQVAFSHWFIHGFPCQLMLPIASLYLRASKDRQHSTFMMHGWTFNSHLGTTAESSHRFVEVFATLFWFIWTMRQNLIIDDTVLWCCCCHHLAFSLSLLTTSSSLSSLTGCYVDDWRLRGKRKRDQHGRGRGIQ